MKIVRRRTYAGYDITVSVTTEELRERATSALGRQVSRAVVREVYEATEETDAAAQAAVKANNDTLTE